MKIYARNIIPFIAILAFHSCSGPDKKSGGKVATSTTEAVSDSATRARTAAAVPDLRVDEKEFALRASTGGMMEVEAAKIALQKTRNAAVKDFAARMVKDHGLANKELATIANARGISLATTLPEDHINELDNLSALSDRPFDVQYIKMMIDDHNRTLVLFTNGTRLANPELKAFAQKTLPVIKKHFEMALEIGKALNIKNVNLGDDVLNISPTEDHTH